MAELHEALKALSPTTWDDVPLDDLSPYMTALLTSGELICNSVPPPVDGTPFLEAKPHFDQPNGATSHKDVLPSQARSHPPSKDHEDLQKNWGKAMKFSAKENPLNIAVYKMAGKDRFGAWFARRSVHEGIGFSKFINAMKSEFDESLAVEGGPGSGSIRGIGADTRLEKKEVDGLGAVEVYQLSAQFPGPTTPREFIPLILTSDQAMTKMSAAQTSDGQTHIPRSHMILSRPITHPNAPERSGYIRGKYESVELVREIPLSKTSDNASNDPELNPVEWIMITRSDPGGGIPRFMVDRGTPSAMLGDVHKWLDWATKYNAENAVSTQAPEKMEEGAPKAVVADAVVTNTNGEAKVVTTSPPVVTEKPRPRSATEPIPQQQEGVVSHLTQALGAGIDAYAPASVSTYMHTYTDGTGAPADDDYDSSSSSSSSDSFMSAEESRRMSIVAEDPLNPTKSDSPAGSSQVSLASLETLKQQRSLGHHEKEVLKLAKQREKLDRKLAKKREDEEARLRRARESESGEQEKAKERHDREVRKSEEKHRREMEKLESRKDKEARKAEEKRQKRGERDVVSRVTRERDQFRGQMELLRKEVELLHEQVGDLQKENTAMAVKLGKLGGADGEVAVGRSSMSSVGGRSRASTKTEK
jgi:hypothetical protein